PRARRGDAAAADAQPRHDHPRVPGALRAQDRQAHRGRLPSRLRRRRAARSVRPQPRHRVPDRRRHPRLRRPDAGDRQDPGHGPARGDADDAAAARGAAGRHRAPRARRRPRRRRARARRPDRRHPALARGRARACAPRRRGASRRARGPHLRDRRPGRVTSVAIRLGRIGYVNMAPVFFRLGADVEEVVGVPTELNRQVVAGELDIAPISSIAYARHADRLRLLPRLCVSSEGAVESIQLVSKTPLPRIRTVAVTPESATSVVLTRVLLPDAEHVPLGEEAEATLLIGDAALRSAFEDPTPHHDLGRLWLERTGLPMVFAVWAAPEPMHPELPELEEALVASVRAAREQPELLAYESAERYGYPPGFLARYFEKLRYRFGPRERAGLYTFLELAQQVGELEQVPELRFVSAGAAV